jgi:hypothetical protein
MAQQIAARQLKMNLHLKPQVLLPIDDVLSNATSCLRMLERMSVHPCVTGNI